MFVPHIRSVYPIESHQRRKRIALGIIIALVVIGAIIGLFRWGRQIIVTGNDSPERSVSPLTGQPCDHPDQRPLAVMIAGDPVARPLSGIASADFVIEMPVTPNGVTRMMAVYQCNWPTEIGSVRSAREGFLPYGAWLDVIYAHWGGEHGALEALDRGVLDNIDALKYENTTFLRKDSIPRPHNGFTTIQLLIDRAKKLGYTLTGTAPTLPHTSSKPKTNLANIVDQVTIPYPAPYTVRWQYDSTTNLYTRFRDGTPEIDATNKQSVRAGSVVVLHTTGEPLRDQYLTLHTEGTGLAKIFQHNTVVEGTWRKDSTTRSSPLELLDRTGKPIALAPGPIWVEFITFELP